MPSVKPVELLLRSSQAPVGPVLDTHKLGLQLGYALAQTRDLGSFLRLNR